MKADMLKQAAEKQCLSDEKKEKKHAFLKLVDLPGSENAVTVEVPAQDLFIKFAYPRVIRYLSTLIMVQTTPRDAFKCLQRRDQCRIKTGWMLLHHQPFVPVSWSLPGRRSSPCKRPSGCLQLQRIRVDRLNRRILLRLSKNHSHIHLSFRPSLLYLLQPFAIHRH